MDASMIVALFSLLVSITNYIVTNRQDKLHAKSVAYGKIRDQLFKLNQLEFDNPDLFPPLKDEISKEWLKVGGRGHYLFMFFSLYEEIFTQHKKFHLIDKEEYESWDRRLRHHLSSRRAVLCYWKEYYSREAPSDFRSYVAGIINSSNLY